MGFTTIFVSLAILLAKGETLALVPLYLGSLHARLNECLGIRSTQSLNTTV